MSNYRNVSVCTVQVFKMCFISDKTSFKGKGELAGAQNLRFSCDFFSKSEFGCQFVSCPVGNVLKSKNLFLYKPKWSSEVWQLYKKYTLLFLEHLKSVFRCASNCCGLCSCIGDICAVEDHINPNGNYILPHFRKK